MTDQEYRELNDEQLCRLAEGGDGRAEELLMQRYVWLVRKCARPFFLAGGDSEDLIQEGMLGLLSAIRKYDHTRAAGFRTFALTCVENRIRTAVRNASGNRHMPLNDSVSLELFSGASPVYDRSDPENLIIEHEGAGEIFRALERSLSALEKQILSEYLSGLSYKAISVKLDRSEKAVDNGVQRIRRKLERILQSGEYSES